MTGKPTIRVEKNPTTWVAQTSYNESSTLQILIKKKKNQTKKPIKKKEKNGQ